LEECILNLDFVKASSQIVEVYFIFGFLSQGPSIKLKRDKIQYKQNPESGVRLTLQATLLTP
jgi:hypothetical protein